MEKQYIATKIPTGIVEQIDEIVATRVFSTRSHFLEVAVLDLIVKCAPKHTDREIVQGIE